MKNESLLDRRRIFATIRTYGSPTKTGSAPGGCSCWSVSPNADTADLSKKQLVTWLLGSHEYLLQCIEAWATQITVRYGLDTMFDIEWILWSETVPPGVKQLKAEYPGIKGTLSKTG